MTDDDVSGEEARLNAKTEEKLRTPPLKRSSSFRDKNTHNNRGRTPRFAAFATPVRDLHNLTLHNQPMPKLKSIRYPGVTVSQPCSLLADLELTLKKFRNRANLLHLIRARIRSCNTKALLHTYKSFIRPVIEYQAPLYASLSRRALNRIQACE